MSKTWLTFWNGMLKAFMIEMVPLAASSILTCPATAAFPKAVSRTLACSRLALVDEKMLYSAGWICSNGTAILLATSKPILDRSSRLRSEEHTSELQSLRHLVCRLLLEK